MGERFLIIKSEDGEAQASQEEPKQETQKSETEPQTQPETQSETKAEAKGQAQESQELQQDDELKALLKKAIDLLQKLLAKPYGYGYGYGYGYPAPPVKKEGGEATEQVQKDGEGQTKDPIAELNDRLAQIQKKLEEIEKTAIPRSTEPEKEQVKKEKSIWEPIFVGTPLDPRLRGGGENG